MNQTGIYEELITQMLHEKLEKINSEFYIEKEILEPAEAASRLSAFLSKIIYYALQSIEDVDDRLKKQIEFSNAVITWICEYIEDAELSENLLESQGQILKALFEKKNPIAADIRKYISE